MCLQYVLWKLVIEGLSRYSADFNAATKFLVQPKDKLLLTRAYFEVAYNTQEIEVATYLCYIFLGLGATYFVYNFYIHFLMNLVESKSYLAFKFFACCCFCKLRPFEQKNMHSRVFFTGRKVVDLDGGKDHLMKIDPVEKQEEKDSNQREPTSNV